MVDDIAEKVSTRRPVQTDCMRDAAELVVDLRLQSRRCGRGLHILGHATTWLRIGSADDVSLGVESPYPEHKKSK
uniref:Uncharacterized protein n=1 Tax=Utricularia reniformis TaxID=192314 RepID=A0A1Y0B165_9LAMI|nr:hypothetical protein AEK19_MT0936 [Utricularia reniformis]ART31160.1 hypothetical protein AEK19_MT0936 [Utricularia reniformis]